MDESALKAIDDKLDELRNWTIAHDARHEMVSLHVAELRHDMYGDRGVKPGLQRIRSVCEGRTACSPWFGFFLDILKTIIGNGALMLIVWLLYVYKRT